MQKTAQKRSLPSKLREMINIPGSYVEGFFKPEMDRVMASLKELDDRIRSVLVGKKIGTAEAPEDGIAAKDLLKSARTNFNRREYMAGVADLGHFHKKMWDITRDIDKFFVDVNKIHHKFLFEGLKDTGYEDKLQKFREHMESLQRKAEESSEYFIKEAGIMDFFYNIGTKRGRSLAAWEKKYPKETKDLREGGDRLINEAQKLLDATIVYLKQMATARAIRRPDDYMDTARKIKAEFDKFHSGDKGFEAYYRGPVSKWLVIKDQIEKEEAERAAKTAPPPAAPTAGKIELGTEPKPPAPPVPPGPPGVQLGGPPGASPPFTPPPPEAPITEKTLPTSEEPKIRIAHQRFIKSLETLSQEDPLILANYISKYATSIQDKDPETAISLFALAKQIKE